MTSARARLTVVVPTYNEAASVETILDRVVRTGRADEIVVVDDGSKDGTPDLVDRWASQDPARTVRLVRQVPNQGKGAAVRRGFAEATGDWILVQDADLEYNPEDYPVLLAPLETGEADVVFGSRFLNPANRFIPANRVGNRVLTWWLNVLTRQRITDAWTGYKVFRREVLRGLPLRENRFGFEPEITARVARGRWRLVEVPISYSPRTKREGKKIAIRDGLLGLWSTFRYAVLSRAPRRTASAPVAGPALKS